MKEHMNEQDIKIDTQLNNIASLIAAREKYNCYTDYKAPIYMQARKNLEALIAQCCFEFCEEFKKNNIVEQATDKSNVNHYSNSENWRELN